MITWISDIFFIWDTRDYLVWFFILFTVFFVIFDIQFKYAEKITKNLKIKKEDFVFTILLISVLIFFVLDIKINHISRFFGFVNYGEARLYILRSKIIVWFTYTYLGLSTFLPFICAFYAKKYNLAVSKWFIWGLFFNLLAYIYLLTIIKESKGRDE